MAIDRPRVGAGSCGFFGKVPTHGDFVQRGLPVGFVQRWDAWLSDVLTGSRQVLGGQWLVRYLYSPLWRFVLDEGVIDAAVWAGVLAPSVDRVGRYYPLTIAARWPTETPLTRLAIDGDTWFAEIEQLALWALDAEELEPDTFQQRIETLQRPVGTAPEGRCVLGVWSGRWPEGSNLAASWCCHHATLMHDALSPATLWWRTPSPDAPGEWLAQSGLPGSHTYVRLLGSASSVADESVSDTNHLDTEAPIQGIVPLEAEHRIRSFQSAGTTHTGHVRADNQDAWLALPEQGCWVVADGMGGHDNGALASRTIIEHVERALVGTSSLDQRVAALLQALDQSNERLRSPHGEIPGSFFGGSTVVALLLEAERGEVLWAGDSRLYRWRPADATFDLLTRDHVAAPQPGGTNHAITRAVGGEDTLDVERIRFEVLSGDRYLLCSDGVHGLVPDDALVTLVRHSDAAEDLCSAIARAVLAGPAPDNLTAVVVMVS